MVGPNEAKFSLTLEAKLLWERLAREKRTEDFQTKFWELRQGIIARQTLKREGLEPVRISIEKRSGDFCQNLYVQVKTIT